MSDPYVGEIRLFPYGGSRALRNWLPCDGATYQVSAFEILYAVIGNTYGGALPTFAVPDLRGRVPIAYGQGTGLQSYAIGAHGGAESVTLTPAQIPAHAHTLAASTANGSTAIPGSSTILAAVPGQTPYWSGVGGFPVGTLNPNAITSSGSGLPHDNMMPSMALKYYICSNGIFPTQD
jgi:microcystin-dependent protein